jgi:hypothetical protein
MVGADTTETRMATRDARPTGSGLPADRRRSPDRRSAPREGQSGKKGRRATDDAARTAPTADKTGNARKRRATRDGREPLVIYLRPESIKALKIAALERDITASAVMAEALGLWFRSEGRSTRR